MKLLLDTHILLWALNDNPKLPKKAKDLILEDDNEIYYSTASVWEITIKHMAKPERIKISGKEMSDLGQGERVCFWKMGVCRGKPDVVIFCFSMPRRVW